MNAGQSKTEGGQSNTEGGQSAILAGKPKLYGYWRSSASWRVRWALEFKNVAFEYVPVNILKGEHREAANLKRSPLGQLPVFEVNGQFLGESLAILNFIESQWPQNPLLPSDPWLRAKTWELCEVINAGTAPLQTPFVQKLHTDDSQKRLEWAQGFVERGLRAFAALRNDKKATFSMGSTITLADLLLVPQVYNALRYEISVKDKMPDLFAIYERCLATEPCLKASPERQSDAVL